MTFSVISPQYFNAFVLKCMPCWFLKNYYQYSEHQSLIGPDQHAGLSLNQPTSHRCACSSHVKHHKSPTHTHSPWQHENVCPHRSTHPTISTTELGLEMSRLDRLQLGASFFSSNLNFTFVFLYLSIFRRSHGTDGTPMAQPRSDQNLGVCIPFAVAVCVFGVCVDVLIGVWAAGVCFCDLIDFIRRLLIVCVFELPVRVEVFIPAFAMCVFLMRVRQVFVKVCQVFLHLCVWFLCLRVDDLIDPAPKAADSSVERRWGRVAAALTPCHDPSEDPTTGLPLTH